VPANVPRSELYPALVRFYHADYNGEQVRIAALLQPVFDDSMRGNSTVHLANRLLTLARIEHGSEGAVMTRVSLPAIARQVGLELALPTVQMQIDLALEAPDEAWINGQPLMLHELVANLADNAIRYTPPGAACCCGCRHWPAG
jgi:two-component system sensor histidine kinase TctE